MVRGAFGGVDERQQILAVAGDSWVECFDDPRQTCEVEWRQFQKLCLANETLNVLAPTKF